MSALPGCFSVEDIRKLARRRLPKLVFDWMEGGADGEECIDRNRVALSRIALLSRYCIDASACDMDVSLFGRTWSLPLGIAPTGLGGLVWPGCDVYRAAAARDANIPFVMSNASTSRMEDVLAIAPDHTWFQHYAFKDGAVNADLYRRIWSAGVRILVVTVDVPTSSKRLRDLRNNLTVPFGLKPRHILDFAMNPKWLMATAKAGQPSMVNLNPYADAAGASSLAAYMASQNGARFDWEAARALRRNWQGILVLKGLMAPSDVALAAAIGADGVIVSNHGGRQLAAAPSPVEVVSACVEAANDRLAVMIDSGIRTGLDVVRCLALGARMAFIGRPSLYGLAATGDQRGLDAVLTILRDEVDRAMRQTGRMTVADIGSDAVFAPG